MTMKETGQFVGRNKLSITAILTGIGVVGAAFYGAGQIAESEWRVPLVFEMREADEKVILHANGQVRSMANDFEAVADELETRIAANAEKIKDGEVQRKRAEKRSFQQQEIDLQLAIPKLKDAGVDTTDKERRVLEIQNTIREIEAEIERLE